MEKKKVGLVVGSLRKGAYSKMVAKAIKELAPSSLELTDVDISALPLYNQDFDEESNTPPTYKPFRETIKGLDAVLFITPEHNRSFPAALKNALDIGSRPWGQNLWDGKPAAIISQSIGAYGGFGANHHLRQVLAFLNVPVMQQPEAYLGDIGESFDNSGNLTDRTREALKNFMTSFEAWIERLTK